MDTSERYRRKNILFQRSFTITDASANTTGIFNFEVDLRDSSDWGVWLLIDGVAVPCGLDLKTYAVPVWEAMNRASLPTAAATLNVVAPNSCTAGVTSGNCSVEPSGFGYLKGTVDGKAAVTGGATAVVTVLVMGRSDRT